MVAPTKTITEQVEKFKRNVEYTDFFSEKKQIAYDQNVNRWNDKWLWVGPSDFHYIMSTSFLAFIMA